MNIVYDLEVQNLIHLYNRILLFELVIFTESGSESTSLEI